MSIADKPAADGANPQEVSCGASLSDEERMLLTIRDSLYEGNWDDFVQDLRSRMDGKPYVFDIHAPDARLRETISRHLELIDGLRKAEARTGAIFHAG